MSQESKDYQRNYYQNNKGKFQQYYENNKDIYYERAKEFRLNNPERVKVYYQNLIDKDPELFLKKRCVIQKNYYDRMKGIKVYCEFCKKDVNKRSLYLHNKGKKHSFALNEAEAGK